jgi:hypothetical protein
MSGTHGHIDLPEPVEPPPVFGIAFATGTLSLAGVPQTTGANQVNALPVPGCEIALPSAGTYDVWADAHGGLIGNEPPTDETLYARLWNVTTNALVPGSETAIVALTNWSDDPPGGPTDSPTDVKHHAEGTGSVRVPITVPGPTTIRLEAYHFVGGNIGTPADLQYGATLSGVGSDPAANDKGVTRLGFIKIT